jgi:uncharacterized repeat protein (TIGR03806 family)
MKLRLLLFSAISLALICISLSSYRLEDKEDLSKYPDKLSDWHFFEGKLSDLNPKSDVIPYELRTPLFSDYAQKLRFVKIPSGQKAKFDPKEVFDFPKGTILIKNFYYTNDLRKPEKGRRIIETRLLVHETNGWENLVYIWNEDQTEAILDLAGDTKTVTWKDEKGKNQKLDYIIPNKNQCKGCHSFNNQVKPIGPTARQLNGDFTYKSGQDNQLQYWKKAAILDDLPPDLNSVDKIAIWDDPQSGTLDQRARAWLDINCAHCHRPEGPGSTSGLYLSYYEENKTALGIFKTPVAAGRGSGGFAYDIEPGKPEKSILVYRIHSSDPGIMMPEIARKLVHKEGVELISQWIKEMKQ